jgi:hypothetical protein
MALPGMKNFVLFLEMTLLSRKTSLFVLGMTLLGIKDFCSVFEKGISGYKKL